MLQCRPAEEFSFGPRALKDALVSTDPALQQLYASAFSPAERLFLAEAYNPRRTLFRTLLIRSAFDWLLSRPEAPEDFEAFHAALPPRKQGPTQKHIYLQPIGARGRGRGPRAAGGEELGGGGPGLAGSPGRGGDKGLDPAPGGGSVPRPQAGHDLRGDTLAGVTQLAGVAGGSRGAGHHGRGSRWG